MATPCPRCGATKTESVRHGLIYETLWKMGLHLRRCSFCNRRRLFKRVDRNRPHPDDMTQEQLQEYYNRKIAEAGGVVSKPYQAPSPHTISGPPEVESPQEDSATDASVGVAVTTEESEPRYSCPKCGGGLIRRSRRKFYERWFRRPRMARCMRCDHRFPYPD